MSPQSNRDLLLDAAEVLFAERGVGRVSLRSIQTAAGLSVGSIQYHFDSETELVREVLSRRTIPLFDHRLRGLRRLSKSAQPTARQVVDVMLAPLVLSYTKMPEKALLHVKILQQMQADHFKIPYSFVDRAPETHERVSALLCRTLPNIPAETIKLRFEIVWDTIVSSVSRWAGNDDSNFTQFAVTLAEFLAGALEAPNAAVRVSSTRHQGARVPVQLIAP